LSDYHKIEKAKTKHPEVVALSPTKLEII